MLEKIREGTQGPIAKIILGLVILSFALAGIGSYLRNPSEQYAADVNGDKITQAEWERAYQQQRSRLEAQLDGDMFSRLAGNDAYLKQFRNSVLEDLINNRLLLQAAEDTGLWIGDKQVAEAIRGMNEFKDKDGNFSTERYTSLLATAGYSPDQFKETIRSDLVRQQLVRAVVNTSFELPEEVEQRYALQYQQRQVAYWTIAAEQFAADIKPDEADIEAYYQAHVDSYQAPEQVKVAYIELKESDLSKEIIAPTEQDIESYYNEHIGQYQQPARRQLAHILLTGDDAQQKAEQLKAQLDKGASFAELAKAHSADTYSGKKGGELGWFNSGEQLDPAFAKVAFALTKEGQISEPVKSSFGIHLIKLEALQKQHTKPLSEVKDSVIADIKSDKANDKFYDIQQKLTDAAYESPDSLQSAADASGLPIQHTDLFTQADAPALFQPSDLLTKVFDQDQITSQINSEPVEVQPGHIVVFHIDNFVDAHTRSLDDVHQQVLDALVQERAKAKASEVAKALLAALEKGEDIGASFQGAKVESHAKQWLTRDEQTLPRAIRDTAFSSTYAGKIDRRDVETSNGAAVLAVSGVKDGTPGSDKDVMKMMQARLTDQRSQQSYQLLLQTLRSEADISYYRHAQDTQG